MNILAFGASTSKKSINKQFATYVGQQFEGNLEIIDLNDFPLPLFSTDLEAEIGHPFIITEFIQKLDHADLIIISFAEHNGNFTTAFKNLFDWTSRVKNKMFENKKLFLVATSTGGRGGLTAIEIAQNRFPRHGAELLGHFALPKFNENFDPEKGILDIQLQNAFVETLEEIKNKLKIQKVYI